jgi:hypothetical protein
MTEVLIDIGVTPVEHPPYSPDLASCDFWTFPMLKHEVQGQKFSTDTEVKQVIDITLCTMYGNSPLHVFEKWVEHCKKCVAYEGITVRKKQCPSIRNPQIVSDVCSLIVFQAPVVCL